MSALFLLCNEEVISFIIHNTKGFTTTRVKFMYMCIKANRSMYLCECVYGLTMKLVGGKKTNATGIFLICNHSGSLR
jgi:hypothetical protein